MGSKSEVVRNRVKVWPFLPSKILGGRPPKVVPIYSHARLAARHVEKFRVVIPLGPKVMTANTLNFKPFSQFSLFEIVGATPVPDEVWVNKPLPFSSTYKNLRGQHPLWRSEKVDFGWVGLNLSRLSCVVSAPKFTKLGLFSSTWAVA